MKRDPSHTARPLWAILLLLGFPLLFGAAIAPWVYQALQALGEVTDALPKLTESRFEKVASRCVMLTAALILYPVIRMTGLLPELRRGLTPSPDRYRDFRQAFLLGAVSMALLYLAGWALGAYGPHPKAPTGMMLPAALAGFFIGALFIGIFEEIFFRGLIFGTLRTRLHGAIALLGSSAFFSVIHFFRPRFPEAVTETSWRTGFELIPHLFARFNPERDVVFAATLFLMGVTLCRFYTRTANLYFIMGLHGGWVLAMLTGANLLRRNPEAWPTLFGHGDLVSKSPLALLVMALFLAASLIPARKSA
ncbi:MAG TPA: CPBP family intramembrane metalloprotease [Kiritimatiellia bacterium]|nr:CPBP family intramembrane metalloprotease [Kiritimatiellia bacterium]HMO98204.1 CPBP family intramembrane metalloprotease [Kiritimatiellia bacterium]HMP96478.1 CPBP family intramembrane metalloprotease [Kiritimatiellia bacterium]